MANELATTGRNAFERYGDAASRQGNFLRFSKGDYVAGIEQEVIPIGTVMLCNMAGLATGWVYWEDGQPIKREMGLLADGYEPPPRTELGDNDKALWAQDDDGKPRDPWQHNTELPMVERDNPDAAYMFVTGSKGGEGAVGELCKAYGRRIRTNPDDLPLIRLDVGSYQHSKREFGRIKFPVFEIVGWIANDEQEASLPTAADVKGILADERRGGRPDGTMAPRTQQDMPERQREPDHIAHQRSEMAAKVERQRQASQREAQSEPRRRRIQNNDIPF